ncbi:MAG: sulfatase [Pedobacter sp.]|nr:sulfatase [Pedobacter sp.]MDQ8054553.1 sulfatase [Pedobacter sp.]
MKRIVIFILSLSCAFSSVAQQRPNIIIIISDDHALSTIGAYGSTYGATPHIDRIAREGATFIHTFVNNSICAPARATLLTGKYSHANGLRDNHDEFDSRQDIFPRRMKNAGFQTAWIGKWHLKTYPDGFDYWNIVPGQGQYYNPSFISMKGDTTKSTGYCTDIITDQALQWLDKRNTSQPFCIVVGQKAPHRTWMPDLQDLGKYDQTKFPLPPNFYDSYDQRIAAKNQDMNLANTLKLGYDLKMKSDTSDQLNSATAFTQRMNIAQRKVWNAYYDKIEADFLQQKPTGNALLDWKFQRYMKDYLSTTLSLDRNVGRILDYLDQHQLAENTIVIYTSDQGFYMGEHGWFDKRFMYEESMHTPFIVRYPGVIKPGISMPQLISNVDFAPTLLTVAGIAPPADMQGRSFADLFKNPTAKFRDAVYYHYYEFPGEHSVMKHFGIRTERYKLIRFYGEQNFWELYDLKTDPHEMKNIYAQVKSGNLVADLKKKLKDLTVTTNDEVALKVLGDGR